MSNSWGCGNLVHSSFKVELSFCRIAFPCISNLLLGIQSHVASKEITRVNLVLMVVIKGTLL